jgi:hypothetical protein
MASIFMVNPASLGSKFSFENRRLNVGPTTLPHARPACIRIDHASFGR